MDAFQYHGEQKDCASALERGIYAALAQTGEWRAKETLVVCGTGNAGRTKVRAPGIVAGRDSVEPHIERSEANAVSILRGECVIPSGDARFARASFVGKQGSTESRPTGDALLITSRKQTFRTLSPGSALERGIYAALAQCLQKSAKVSGRPLVHVTLKRTEVRAPMRRNG